MTPHLAQQIVNVCIATMGVVSIVGFLAVYIDMNNEKKTRQCLADLFVTSFKHAHELQHLLWALGIDDDLKI